MGRSNRKVKHEFEPTGDKKAFIFEKPEGYYNSPPVFSFKKYDANAPWSTSSDNKPVVDSIMKNLSGMEGLYWKDIIKSSGGRKHGTNSHPIKIADLTVEARKRAEKIKLYESELFSLRLQGDVRLWGLIEPKDGRFFVIWYDPNHKVYPVMK